MPLLVCYSSIFLFNSSFYSSSFLITNGGHGKVPKKACKVVKHIQLKVQRKKVQDKGLGAPCREKPLEKSGLEPAAPNRLADRKHCALSTHPNPHLHLDESIKRSASDRLGDLVPQVRARTSPGVFRDMALLGLCLELSFSVLYCRTQANLLLS